MFYPYPHPGMLQIVEYRVYTPVLTLFPGYLPYTKAGHGYGMLYPYPGYCGTGVQNLQIFGYGYE